MGSYIFQALYSEEFPYQPFTISTCIYLCNSYRVVADNKSK